MSPTHRQPSRCESRVLLQKWRGLGLQQMLLHARSTWAISNYLHPTSLRCRHWAVETALLPWNRWSQVLSRQTGHGRFRPWQLSQRHRSVNRRFWSLDLPIWCLLANARRRETQWKGDARINVFPVLFARTGTCTWSTCAWRYYG